MVQITVQLMCMHMKQRSRRRNNQLKNKFMAYIKVHGNTEREDFGEPERKGKKERIGGKLHDHGRLQKGHFLLKFFSFGQQSLCLNIT